MAFIDLDFVFDAPTPMEDVHALTRDGDYPDVSGAVIEEHGPAGGWPIIRWSGSFDALAEFIGDIYAQDHDDRADLLARIAA